MEKLLSVIVPVYNVEKYLPQCIESILFQSLGEIELILVDDGSLDRSGKICDDYAYRDGRIRVFHQGNKGTIEARKKGLLESKSKYATFVDADDFIASDSYIYSVPGMKRDVDVMVFGIIRYFDDENQKEESPAFHEGVYTKEEIEQIIWPKLIWNCETNAFAIDPSLCNKVIKRELLVAAFQKIKDTNFHYGEDVAVIYPMIKQANTMEIINKGYYFHRQRDSIIADYITEPLYFEKLYKLYRHLMDEFGDNELFIKQVEYFYMNSVALRKQIYGGNRGGGDHYLFPFGEVKKGERIVLYGAGTVGQAYMEQIQRTGYCDVVLWVDKYFHKYPFGNVFSVESIKTAVYDRIVIAIENIGLKYIVNRNLVSMGVVQEKILG